MTAKPLEKIIYRDLDIHFQAHPVTKKVKVVENVESIKQSLKNLVMMDAYEAPYQPNLRAHVKGSLFDNLDSGDLTILRRRISDIAALYEPRATVTDVQFKDDLENNRFYLAIYFIPLNGLAPVVVELFLKKVR